MGYGGLVEDMQAATAGIRKGRKLLRQAYAARSVGGMRILILRADKKFLDAMDMADEKDMVGADGKPCRPSWDKD